ncbi:MAG: PepSY-associated TM helix domain-containing protein [Colwellia sp.]
MKSTFRQSMKWLHTWVGLVVVWILFFMFITGTAGYFYKEITRWMEPERPLISPEVSKKQMLHLSQAYLTEHASEAERWRIQLPNSRDGNLRVRWTQAAKEGKRRGKRTHKILNPTTGQEVAELRATGGGFSLYRMHYRLHYMPRLVAYWIVGFCTMLMLIAVITGVIFHKKIFSDFFTFRAKKGLIGWLDIHNVLSVVALPFHFMITYSGLIFFLTTYMVLGFNLSLTDSQQDEFHKQVFPDTLAVEQAEIAQTLAPLTDMYLQTRKYWLEDTLDNVTIKYPNDVNASVNFERLETDITYNHSDEIFFNSNGKLMTVPAREFTPSGRIEDGFISLHEGQFANSVVRWLYLLVGLIGAAMVASGGILWTTKRKPKQDKKPNGADFGYRLVEQLNIGSFVGLPIAIGVYFCANRLLPVGLENRADWEINCLFISWALLLVYPAFRPAISAWLEQLKLAAVIFTFIPVLNFLTTDKHLAITLPIGDWNYAGFDLAMIAIGMSFSFAAYKVKQRIVSQVGNKSITSAVSKASTAKLAQNKGAM